MSLSVGRSSPIQTLLSGPVGGTVGGAAVGSLLGRDRLICIDMGGTSFDASLVLDGRPSASSAMRVEGFDLLMPAVDINTIGAGGGSIAYLEGSALRVGPRSAGSSPGPACYGRGGLEPTVTDADLVLGRIDVQTFLGGNMVVRKDLAENAIGTLAAGLNMGFVDLAEGILRIVDSNMADAIRTITVRHGIDPRDFSLLAFGGAGPLHAAALADELDIAEIVVPPHPGAFSAWGMLHADLKHDGVRPFWGRLATLDPTAPRRYIPRASK